MTTTHEGSWSTSCWHMADTVVPSGGRSVPHSVQSKRPARNLASYCALSCCGGRAPRGLGPYSPPSKMGTETPRPGFLPVYRDLAPHRQIIRSCGFMRLRSCPQSDRARRVGYSLGQLEPKMKDVICLQKHV